MEKQENSFGIVALVLGIIGILTSCIGIGLIFDVIAIVFGIIAITSPKQKSGLGIAGLAIAICSIVIFTFAVSVFSDDDSDSGTISNSTVHDTEVPAEKKTNTSSSISDSDFETTEYSYGNLIGDSIYIVVVKNNSSETVKISATATAFDADGNKLELASDDIYCLEPGKSFPLKFYFDGESADRYEYTMEYNTT